MRAGVVIDLGTVNTLVSTSKHGIVRDEPSVVAVQGTPRRVLAVGASAEALRAGPPEGVEVIRPLHDGVVSDFEACTLMLGGFLRWVLPRHRPSRPRVLVCVPGRATDVERKALTETLRSAYPHVQVQLVDETVAAATGAPGADAATAGGDEPDRQAMLVVDIGGGTTEMGIVVGGGKVRSRSIPIAGNEMDQAVVREVRAAHGLVIGERTAEQLKRSAGLTGEGDPVPVTGLDCTRWGWLRTAEVEPKLVAKALERPVKAILTSLEDLLGEVPADLAHEILDGGVRLAGGGALLQGLPERISEETCCRAEVVPDPLRCVVRGLARMVDQAAQDRPRKAA